jgi:hypothetical protein
MVDLWKNKKYPDGCRNCGQTAKRSIGFGLCYDCYKIPSVLAGAERNPDELIIIEAPTETTETNETLDANPIETQERRPGSFRSPANDGADVLEVEEPKKNKWGFGKKEPKPQGNAPRTNERPPRGSGRRTSVSDTFEDVWTGIGGLAIRSNHAPLGRYLQWQAPGAGQLLDEVVSGTIIDRKLLQPAVKARGKLDVLIALVGPPGIIMAIERQPERAQMLVPALKSALRSSLPTILPAMKKAQAKEEKVNDAIREMFPDMPDGVDPVDLVIEQLFNGYVFNEAPTNEGFDAGDTFTD